MPPLASGPLAECGRAALLALLLGAGIPACAQPAPAPAQASPAPAPEQTDPAPAPEQTNPAPAPEQTDPAPAPAEGVVADLPFLEDSPPGTVHIDLAPEGSARPLRLQLDTGATTTVLTPGAARELGVTVRRLKSTPYRRATRLGRELQFSVDSRSGDQAARSAPFEYGLLGGTFLSHYVVEIDYPARRVRFLDPEIHPVPEKAGEDRTSILPLRMVANRPVLDLEVGEQRVPVLLDTGSPVGVILGGRTVTQLALEPRAIAGLRMFGVVGEVKTGFAEAPVLRLGGFRFENHPLVLAPRGLYQQATASDSVIGHDLLEPFRVRIDYPNRRIAFALDEDPASGHDLGGAALESRLLGLPWEPARKSGALLQLHEGHLYARYIIEGSPAEDMGIEPNDMIDALGTYPRPTDVAAVAAAIVNNRTLRVMRAGKDGYWHPIVFGEPPP